MKDFTKYNVSGAHAKAAQYDEGLRAFMLQVYNYMAGALVLTGAISMFAASSETIMNMLYVMQAGHIVGISGLGWLVTFAPLVLVFAFNFGITRMSVQTVQTLFWTYAALIGLSLSSIFMVYTGESIARVFFITAGVFGAMSIYGYSTKKDLTQFGSFLIMGLIGILIASLINIFLKSTGLQFAVSILSILIFVGLTAYDTQRIKSMYYQFGINNEVSTKVAVMGALALYMDFINIFIQLLQFFGNRRD
ncbi:Inner membrane protein YbhL [Rickettsiales bacterium Ac37b]|nr:Inner membrane protein YbhL [Rickettsiales bacterium Ac37b]